MAGITVPSDLMRMLADLEEVFDKHFQESDMQDLAPFVLKVEYLDTCVALQEEGWAFREKGAHR